MSSQTIRELLRKETESGKLRTRAQLKERMAEIHLQKVISCSDLLWSKLAARPAGLLMILHKCHEYYEFSGELEQLRQDLMRIKDDELPGEEELGMASRIAEKAHSLLMGLKNVSPTVLNHIKDWAQHYSEISDGPSQGDILSTLESIRSMVETELESRKFIYIPSPDDEKIKQAKPFGNRVYQAFPSARQDLTDAGTAFAMELYTACVFHLMRAAEYGIRALAWDRRVKVLTKAGKPYPLDLATWEEILRGLDAEIGKTSLWPKAKGEIRTQATEFYGTAIQEIRGFKDTWRNHVMHTRGEYTQEDAVQIMSHVKRFLMTLASRISEQDRTPCVWTKKQLS